jgi:hypothetical protein
MEEGSKWKEKAARRSPEDGVTRETQEDEETVSNAKDKFRKNASEHEAKSNVMEEKYTKQQPLNGPSWDRKPLTQSSWSIIDDPTTIEDDDDEDYEPPAVCQSCHHYETMLTAHRAHLRPKFHQDGKPSGTINIVSIIS